MLDTPHKQTNKKQPFLRLLISFWFQNNRIEKSFSEHIEPFHSYEYEQSYAIFSDWNDLKIFDNFTFYFRMCRDWLSSTKEKILGYLNPKLSVSKDS